MQYYCNIFILNMAKLPYQIRIKPDQLKVIKERAVQEKRSVNNMIEVLLENGLKYNGIRNENTIQIF